MEIENIPIAEIVPYPNNPRKNDKSVGMVAKSIKEFGFKVPIILDKNNVIIAGHTRLKAAQSLGLTEVPIIWADELTPEQVKAFRIMDNKSAEYSQWDIPKLETEIKELGEAGYDLQLTGIDDGELSDLLGKEIKEDEFDIPKEPKYPVKSGEVYQLGDHRLVCGDSTKKEDVDKLMNGQKADMVFTDPPYNVNICGNNALPPEKQSNSRRFSNDISKRKGSNTTILNDDMTREEFIEFTEAYLSRYFENCDGPYYIFMSCKEWGTIMNKFEELGGHWSSTIIWNKSHFVLSRKDYHPKFEPILYGWKEGNEIKHLNRRDESDVWDFDKPHKSELHPTMKPIELCSKAINNSSNTGNIVLDLFGGSGSTLIASEQLDRGCYMMELDPFYCSVIIERWEKLTGKTAKKL